MDKEHLTWTQIEDLAIRLADQVGDGYDTLLVIARGGLVPGCILAERLNLRSVQIAAVAFYAQGDATLPTPMLLHFPDQASLLEKRVLIVDDVWDSGRTMLAVRARVRAAKGTPVTAVLHFKPGKSRSVLDQPDFHVAETDAWIVYPWEVGSNDLPAAFSR